MSATMDTERCLRCEQFFVPALKASGFPTAAFTMNYCHKCLDNWLGLMPKRGAIIDVEV